MGTSLTSAMKDLSLCFLLVAALHHAGASSCPNVKVLPTLDLARYPGIWYEVASQNLGFLSSCKCSVYNFTCTSDGCGTFDDHFTCNKDPAKPGSDYDLVLKGKIPDLSVPAKMEESPIKPWLPSAPYWVLEVGKEYEYAVVYACVGGLGLSQEFIYIFSRDPKKVPDMDGIVSRLKAQGIDTSAIKHVPQTGCTYPSARSRSAEQTVVPLNDTMACKMPCGKPCVKSKFGTKCIKKEDCCDPSKAYFTDSPYGPVCHCRDKAQVVSEAKTALPPKNLFDKEVPYTCSKPGHCGRAYQACCAGFAAKGFPCQCHLVDGTGQSGNCGTCGSGYSACCAAYKAKGFPCTCD